MSYYSAEIGGGLDKYSKEEIYNMCFSELYTRCQNIASALGTSQVSSRILDSEELSELLYIAYNRDESELLQLSIDQTLSDPEEIKRILQKGGKVKQINKKIILENANNNDFEISRSIGDKKLKNIGIIYEPVITEYTLNRKSRFIIMGTQGLWNALSNEKAAIQVNKSIK